MYTTASSLSPTSPSTVSMTTPSATPVTEEQHDEMAVVAESDPMTTQIDSVSDGEPTERKEGSSRRENGLMKTKRGRRNSKSSRVSGRERKAMKVLPVVVGEHSIS